MIESITIFDELKSCNQNPFIGIIFKLTITVKNYSKIRSNSWMIHIWRSWKLSTSQDPPPPLVHIGPIFFQPLDLARSTSNEHPTPPIFLSPNDNQSIKRKHNNPRMTTYVIRSFLQVGFRFQYQFITLVWLSSDFISFSWSLAVCFFVALYSCVCSYPKISWNVFYL